MIFIAKNIKVHEVHKAPVHRAPFSAVHTLSKREKKTVKGREELGVLGSYAPTPQLSSVNPFFALEVFTLETKEAA